MIISGHVPALPSSRPVLPEDFGENIINYIEQNSFAISYFIVSLTLGVLVEIYGLSQRGKIINPQINSSAVIILGIFILNSGIWVLSDSSTLSVFTTDYGGDLDKNIITFVSFISFMLLPIIFLSFLRHISSAKSLSKINGLFILNLSVFVILTWFNAPSQWYFVSLMVHHILIYIITIVSMIKIIRVFRNNKNKSTSWFLRGLIIFMICSTIALVMFILQLPNVYVIIYSIGFFILMGYMFRLTIHMIHSSYNRSIKSALYHSLAYTDKLTNLKNRNAFITEQYEKPIKENTCCIVLDINKLKNVNDALGHNYGDKLIRHCAKIISDSFSDSGTCYRIGGDEFVVVYHSVDECYINRLIGKMEEQIKKANKNSELQISIACGYAFSNSDTERFIDLFHAADKNMYFNKKMNITQRSIIR